MWIALLIVLAGIPVLGMATAGGAYLFLQQRYQRWLADAEAAYARQDWEEAIRNYSQYLPQEPDNIDLLLRYVDANQQMMKHRRGALAKVATAYAQILTYDRDNLEVRTKLINLYEKTYSWLPLEWYTKLWLAADPDDLTYRYYHALALEGLGRREEATAEYRQLIDSGTTTLDVYGHLSKLLRDGGRGPEAQQVLEHALELFPDNARLHVYLARLLSRDHDLVRMDEELQRALEAGPDDFEVLSIASKYAAAVQRDPDRALALLEHAHAQNPDDALACLVLADAYQEREQFDKAVQLLQSVPRHIAVDFPELLIALANGQISAGLLEEAHDTIAFYRAAYPNDRPVFDYFAARELQENGDAAGAVGLLANTVSRLPRFYPARFALAVAYLDVEEPHMARSTLMAYLGEKPSDLRAQTLMAQRFGRPPTLDQMARRAAEVLGAERVSSTTLTQTGTSLFNIARQNGETGQHLDLLRQLFTRAIEQDSLQIEAYRGLADALATVGDIDGARQVLRQASEAGIPAGDLTMTCARVSLAETDTRTARTLCDEALATQDASPATVDSWAGLFAAHGQPDAALAILGQAIETAEPHDRTLLALSRARLAAQLGRTREAVEWLEEITPSLPRENDIRDQFAQTRGLVAVRLLGNQDPAAEQQARRLVEAGRAEDSDDLNLSTAEALLLLRETPPKSEEAQSILENVVAFQPGNVSALLALTHILAGQGELVDALDYAGRAVTVAPGLLQAHLYLAELRIQAGQFLEAGGELDRILRYDPKHPVALRLLASYCLANGQLDRAEQALSELDKIAMPNPGERAAADGLRTQLLMAREDFAQAEHVLRAQLESQPPTFSEVRNLAVAVAAQGREREAAALLEAYVQEHANNAGSWAALADFYLSMGGSSALRKASSALTRALLIDPDHGLALLKAIDVYTRQGAGLEALGLCDRYLALRPNDPEGLYRKATLLAEAVDDAQGALDTVSRAIKLNPRPEYLVLRGLARLALEDYDSALVDLRDAATGMHRVSARLDAGLAEAYLGLEEVDLARTYVESARSKEAAGDGSATAYIRRLDKLLKRRQSVATGEENTGS